MPQLDMADPRAANSDVRGDFKTIRVVSPTIVERGTVCPARL